MRKQADVVDRLGLPSDVEVEKLVLGAAMTTADSVAEVAELSSEVFAVEVHRRIHSMIVKLAERHAEVDFITVTSALNDAGALEGVGGMSYILSLADHLPEVFALSSYIRRLKTLSLTRRAALTLHSAIQDVVQWRDEDSIHRAEEALKKITSEAAADSRRGLVSIGEFLETYDGGIEQFLAPTGQEGVVSPWPSLNAAVCGLAPGSLSIIGARPSMGKSQVALQWAIGAAKRGQAVGVFSLEMRAEELWQRAVALEANDAPDAVAKHRVRSVKPVNTLSEIPLLIDQTMSQTLASLQSSVRRANANRKLALVVVDYLQLMTAKGANRTEEVGVISRGLKMLAREEKVAILALSQLNRESVKEDRPPKLSDLRDSGAVEQDADLVAFLHQSGSDRAEMWRSRAPAPYEVIIAKQRNGPAGARVRMCWNFPIARLEEWEAAR